MNYIKLHIICFLISLSVMVCFILGFLMNENPKLQFLIDKFNNAAKIYKIHKTYISTDKEVYSTNEIIWMKLFLVNGTTHHFDSLNTNLYVELINPENKIVNTTLIRLKNGEGEGYIKLNDSLMNGDYQLRAYTNWMRNFDNSYIFTKSIVYQNLKNQQFSYEFYKQAKKLSRNLQDFEIQFFPEGGSLIVGMNSRIAFKIYDKSGRGISTDGFIKDNNGNITQFAVNHNGMGFFNFIPQKGMKYKAYVNRNGKKVRCNFPEAQEIGYVMSVDNFDSLNLSIQIKTNKSLTNDPDANTVFVIGQTRGQIYYSHEIKLENAKSKVEISKQNFPQGVAQVTLFDHRGYPQAERLVYIDKNCSRSLKCYEYNISNDSCTMTISGIENDVFHLSVSVTESDKILTESNINSYFMLTSELQGWVENPAYYFEFKSDDAIRNLDLLLMTHGWRKYCWDDILENKLPKPTHNEEQGITISGTLTNLLIKKPTADAYVSLTFLNKYNEFLETISDENGYFEFKGIDCMDTIEIFLEAKNRNDKPNTIIKLTETDTIPLTFNYFRLLSPDLLKRKNIKPVKSKSEYRTTQGALHRSANYVIYFDKISANTYSNVMDILQQHVPSLIKYGDSYRLRGTNSITQSNEPLYLMDDTPITPQSINTISPNELDRVEILSSGANSAIYGSRGSNGVIAFYTKRGHNIIKGKLHAKIMGYQSFKKFYPVFYENDAPNLAKASTIYWNPKVVIDKNENILKFPVLYKSNTKYVVRIEGISNNGKIGFGVFNLQ